MIIHYKTYQNLSEDTKILLNSLPNDLDLIVGIPRSGMIPAYMLGFLLNLPVISLDEFISIKFINSHNTRVLKQKKEKEKQKVLVIDDSLDSGNSLYKVKKIIEPIRKKYIKI